jgi:aerobic C4-dicarboxylate transport protein
LYFEIVTTFALVIGIAVAYLIQPGKVDKSGLSIQDPAKFTANPKAFSWMDFFLANTTLQVLTAAIIVGVALNFIKQRESVILFLGRLSKIVFTGLKYVMYLAPIGAFGGMAYTIGKFGLETLIPLAKLMLTVYITMALFIFVVLGSILRYYKISILGLLRYIKEELLIVLGTSSSKRLCHPSWSSSKNWVAADR